MTKESNSTTSLEPLRFASTVDYRLVGGKVCLGFWHHALVAESRLDLPSPICIQLQLRGNCSLGVGTLLWVSPCGA